MERALIAYLLGALLGSVSLAVETVAMNSTMRIGAVLFYTILGGTLAAATRGAAEIWIPGYGARGACFVALSAFVSLHLAYFTNVKVLPAEPYWTPLSLGVDAAVVGLVLGLAYAVLRSTRAQDMRLRFGKLAAGGGLVTLVLGAVGLILAWPQADRPAQESKAMGPERPNLLLVVLDSARRDSLGVYGHSRPTSPSLDQWVPNARVFTEALSASSWTVPSVEELLQAEGGRDSLVRRLAASGYATGCFTDNPHLYPGSPLLGGFERVERSVGRWRSLLRGTILGETVERLDPGDDRRLVARAREWGAARFAPFFLYAHLMDSHTPYRHEPIDGINRPGRHIDFPATGMLMTGEEAADVVARYEGGVRSADRALGDLLAFVQGAGRPWLAVVTSDHGESLGEEGRWFHGQTLAPELLEIPLVVLGSGLQPGRFAGVVGHAAVPQTLARAAGLGGPGAQVDLRLTDGPGIAEGGLPPSLLYRVEGPYKLVVDLKADRVRLFDRRLDPKETRDLSSAEAARAAGMALQVSQRPSMSPAPADQDQVERLKALGYAGTGADHSGSR